MGGIDSTALIFIPLAVLVESDIEVCCLLGLLLSQVGSPPAHHRGVEDSPYARADVASVEPLGYRHQTFPVAGSAAANPTGKDLTFYVEPKLWERTPISQRPEDYRDLETKDSLKSLYWQPRNLQTVMSLVNDAVAGKVRGGHVSVNQPSTGTLEGDEFVWPLNSL